MLKVKRFQIIPTVAAPTANTKTSVILVTVIATPEYFKACAIFSPEERWACSLLFLTLVNDCIITNMSSIPIPRPSRGSNWWVAVKGNPAIFRGQGVTLSGSVQV